MKNPDSSKERKEVVPDKVTSHNLSGSGLIEITEQTIHDLMWYGLRIADHLGEIRFEMPDLSTNRMLIESIACALRDSDVSVIHIYDIIYDRIADSLTLYV